jgi:hypothetical protein
MVSSENHIRFARCILKICGLEERVASLANLPAFVSFDAAHQKCVTHSLSNFPDFFEVAVDVFSTLESQGQDTEKTKQALHKTLQSLKGNVSDSSNFMEKFYHNKKLFFYSQILDSLDSIKTQYSQETNASGLPGADFLNDNKNALFLAVASYIYFDLWIKPRQVFLPQSSYCSGVWGLWDEIDYSQLSEYFVAGDQGEQIFFSLFEESNWNEEFDGLSMLKAIIIRMGEMGGPPIDYSIIDWNIRILLRYLGPQGYCRADPELEFLKKQEIKLKVLFKEKFSKQ